MRLAHADTVGPGNPLPHVLTYKADLSFSLLYPLDSRLCLSLSLLLLGPPSARAELAQVGLGGARVVRGGRKSVSPTGNSHGLGVRRPAFESPRCPVSHEVLTSPSEPRSLIGQEESAPPWARHCVWGRRISGDLD